MSKIELDPVGSGFNLSKINENFQKVEDELNDKVLYRDNPVGEPNAWLKDQDANNKRLLNLPDAVTPGEPITSRQFSVGAAGIQTVGILKSEVVATASQVLFSTPEYVPGSNNLSVYVDGIRLLSSEYTETSSTSVTLSVGVSVGILVELIVNEYPELAGTQAASSITFTQTGTGAVASNVQSKLEESVSIKDFGATGLGVVDDTAFMQAASDSGAGEVRLPPGTYNITAALNLTIPGQRFVGAGKGVTIIEQTVVNKNGINIQADNVYIGHLQVKGITQDDAQEYHAILWEDVDGTVVEHCKVDTSDDAGIRCGYNSGAGDPGAPSTNSKILFNDIVNVTNGSGIEIIGAQDVLCEGNDIEGVFEHGVRIVGSSRVRCVNNIIEHFAEGGGGEGIQIGGGTTPGPLINPAVENIVTGNIIRLNTNISDTGGRTGIFMGQDAIDCIVAYNFIDITDTTGPTNINGIIARGTSAVTGSHDGSADASVLSDSGAAFVVSSLIGKVVTNITDGSTGTITANTATTVTATLSGGTDDDWDSGDSYSITGSESLIRCTISNNIIGGHMIVGIKMINTSSHIKVVDNTVSGFTITGITFGTTTDLVCATNTFIGRNKTDNATAIDFDVSVIDAAISGNSISDVGRAFNLRGVASRVSITGNVASKLIVTGGTAYGFNVITTGDNLLISDNVISNIGAVSGDFLQYANIAVGATDRVFFYDNIIEGDAAATLVAFQDGTGLFDIRYAANVQTLADNATPSVDRLRSVKTGGTTTITNFIDGVVGMDILIRADHSVTITDNAFLELGANYAMTPSDTLSLHMFTDTVWTEMGRSVN